MTENINQYPNRQLGLTLYTAIGLLASPALLPRLLLRHWPLSRALAGVRERMGRLPAGLPQGGIWVHAASAGEARAALALSRALDLAWPGTPVVHSCLTPSGHQVLSAGGRPVLYFPLDLPGPTRRALDRLKPRLVLLVETEIWPRFLDTCRQRGIPAAVVSGRISPGRLRGYLRAAPLFRSSLEALRMCCVQAPEEAERFASLGIPRDRLRVTGNLKFDITPPGENEQIASPYRAQESDLVLVAGSTRAGEEDAVCVAFRALREHRPRSLLILVPRHPQRAAHALGTALRTLGPSSARMRSGLPSGGRPPDCSCVVVDRMGELAALYRLASIAFVGGSLVPAGGHTPIEPASCGVPTLFGPHMEHVREVSRALIDAGGAVQVSGAQDLRRQILTLAGDSALRARLGRNARQLIETHRGAARRTVEALTDLESMRHARAAAGS